MATIKRLIVLLALAALYLPAARATTVTGKVTDPAGTAVSGASVTFQLINIGRGNVARVSGSSVVAPTAVVATSAGDGTFTATVTGNDLITPSGTLYEVVIRGPGFTYGPFDYSITGASADLNSLTPLATFSNTPSQVSAAALPGTISTAALHDKGGERFDVVSYGLTPGDSVDNTAALNSLITTVYNAGGGTILFPCGETYLVSGAITLPNDGNSTAPKQPPLRLTSTCTESLNNNVDVSSGGATLDLQYAAPYGKIVTQGLGTLEIDHLNIVDNGADNTPFFYDTNTTFRIHNDIFRGNPACSVTTCAQDAIILGGANASAPITSLDTYFRGFGSHITGNTFSHIRHAVVANMDVNGLVLSNNMVDSTSGSNLPDDAPFLFTGSSSLYIAGGMVSGNLVEELGYTYGVKLADYTEGITFVGNNFYDPGAQTVSDFDIGTCNVTSNYIFLGQVGVNGSVTNGCSTGLGNVVQTASQSYALAGQTRTGSWFGLPLNLEAPINLGVAGTPQSLNFYGDSAGDYYSWVPSASANPEFLLKYQVSGGALEQALCIENFGSDIFGIDFCGSTEGIIDSNAGPLLLRADTQVTNGHSLTVSGQFKQSAVAFASAPGCSSANEGSLQPITDSATNTWGATITGGGSDHVLGYCDGTNWTVAAQ